MAGAKPGNGGRLGLAVLERSDEPVAFRALHVIDSANERILVLDVRSQRLHRAERRARVGWEHTSRIAVAS